MLWYPGSLVDCRQAVNERRIATLAGEVGAFQ
jgi:hypothetical protein